MSEKLKPCPKCESKNVDYSFHGQKEVEIKCHNCLISYTQKCLRLSREELLATMIQKWNNRPIEDKLTSEIERLKVTLLKNIGTFEDLSDALKQSLDALEPFTHKDLSKLVGGNAERDESIIFQRDKAMLKIGDIKRAQKAIKTIGKVTGPRE